MIASEVTVAEFLRTEEGQRLELQLLAGHKGLSRLIRSPRIQKPGLALSGYAYHVHETRVQILGETEINFLAGMQDSDARNYAIDTLLKFEIPCIVVTRGLTPPVELLRQCDRRNVPLLSTHEQTHIFVDRLLSHLRDILATRTNVHGVMVDVHGVGVLITGESGIGKSESALDLILRGHRLVADDVVEIKAYPPSTLIATGPELVRHHMEVRGLGIINIKDLYGVAAIREYKRLELIVELLPWEAVQQVDRIGLERTEEHILSIPVSKVQIPVSPGRNITSIIEVAARNHMLRRQGVDSARDFEQRLMGQIARNAPALVGQDDS